MFDCIMSASFFSVLALLILLIAFSQGKSPQRKVDTTARSDMGLYASKTPIEPVTAGPIADGLDIFRYVVHGIYITLILILILIIVFCPRCSVICDNFCWPYIRTHYNSLANNNTTDDDTPTETAPAKTDVHSTKKNFAVPPETHPKRQTKADIVLAPGGGDKISETISLSSIIARDR